MPRPSTSFFPTRLKFHRRWLRTLIWPPNAWRPGGGLVLPATRLPSREGSRATACRQRNRKSARSLPAPQLGPLPAWIEDAVWIEQAFTEAGQTEPETAPAYPFEDLFTALDRTSRSAGLVRRRCARLRLFRRTGTRLPAAHAPRRAVRALCARPLRAISPKAQRWTKLQCAHKLAQDAGTAALPRIHRRSEKRRLPPAVRRKPVLLRLIAVMTRQWIDATREFVDRAGRRPASNSRELINGARQRQDRRTSASGLSDPHNDGRCVSYRAVSPMARTSCTSQRICGLMWLGVTLSSGSTAPARPLR